MASKDLTIRLLGDLTDLQKKLNQASNDLSKVGATMTKKVTPAAAATAVVLTKLGSDWNSAVDAIIVGTGASGDALDDLLGSTKKIAGQVPNDFGDVGRAVAELNTRLGLTGDDVEVMGKKFLDLSRITKTDVATNIASVSRLFKDWGIDTADQAVTLDMLFEATKRTGIGLERLTTLTVQYGAPLRQLGFSMEEATALFASFEREGVNVETVMAGMRMGLGRMAKAGEEPIETFNRLIEEIKNAGSTGEANKIALEGFGQRAGPDMAAAVREGRFEIAGLVGQLGSAGGALDDASSRTIHLADRLKMLQNRITGALGPFGELGGAAAGVAAGLGPLLFGLGAMAPALSKATTAMKSLNGAMALNLVKTLGLAYVAFGSVNTAVKGLRGETDWLYKDVSALEKPFQLLAKGSYWLGGGMESAESKASKLDATAAEMFASMTSGVYTIEQLTKRLREQGVDTEISNRIIIAFRKQLDATAESETNLAEATAETTAATEDATSAIDSGKRQMLEYVRGLKDAGQESGAWERALVDQAAEQRALEADTRRTDVAIRLLDATFAALRGELSAEEAYETFKTSLKEIREAGDLTDQQIRDLKSNTYDYLEQLGDIPASVVTEIDALLDQGKYAEVEAKLAELERDRQSRIDITAYYRTVGSSKIPVQPTGGKFHDGGVVGGPRGSEQLILAKGGETVLPTHKSSPSGSLGGTGELELGDATLRKLAGYIASASAQAANGAVARNEAGLLAELRRGVR